MPGSRIAVVADVVQPVLLRFYAYLGHKGCCVMQSVL